MLLGLVLMISQFGSIDVSPMGVVASQPARGFTYDAVVDKDRRKVPKVDHRSEDRILDLSRRDKLTANGRDINRNFAVAAWAIRQHLNYVASFRFHCQMKDKGLNRDVEYLVNKRWSTRTGFDAAGRHRRSRFLRLAEIGRILEGDLGVMRLSNGLVQGIEGDRVRNPIGEYGGRWIHGVKVNDSGRALAYAIHKRTDAGGLQFERTIAASNMFLHGAYDRFDQIRGISPIASALNQFRDVYENFDYALAKAKITQLFALAFYRQAEDSAGLVEENDEDLEDDEEGEGASAGGGYKVDFKRGPVLLDLEPGDRAEFLESKQPSSEFQAFTQLVTMVALKSLDVPYSFFDESHTNFFGSRGAWLHYEKSCEEKREDLQDVLRWLTHWRLGLYVLDDELQLPSRMDFGDLIWEWVPTGMPWWDPAKEITGDVKAIAAGLDNPYRIAKERDRGDAEDNVDATAQLCEYARGLGVILSYDLKGQALLKAMSVTGKTEPPPSDDGTDNA